jgi:hypothetical protein
LVHGFKAGAVKISDSVNKILNMSEPITPRYQWDVQGDCFDVGSFCAGEPEHWLYEEVDTEKKVYKIIVNIGMLGDVEANIIENRGSAIAAMIERLQQDKNNVVELMVFSQASNVFGGNTIKVSIDLGCSPLDMDTVGFIMAHAGFFRRMIFASRELIMDRRGHDMGGTNELKPEEIPEGTIYFSGGSIKHLSQLKKDYATLESANNKINEIIEGLIA